MGFRKPIALALADYYAPANTMKLSHTTYKFCVLLGHIVFFAYAPLLIWLALDAGLSATVYRVAMTLLDPGSRSIALSYCFQQSGRPSDW